MTPYQRRLNPFINRVIQDMQIRHFAQNTIDTYSFHIDKFCKFFNKPADQLGPDEVREYQLHLVNVKKASWSSFNQAVCALRFLYEVSLQKPWAVRHIPFGKRGKKLPAVLSDQDAVRLLECIEHPKHRTVLLVCYAAGLRLAEASNLKVHDVDGQRGQIRIRNGKGNKERIVPASPRLLQALRDYWKIGRPTNYLFPGKTPNVPISGTTIQKACKLAVAKARIQQPGVSPHTLRHSYATGMLEAGVDILTISKLLGHASFITTMIYLHVRRQHFDRSPSPIDWLPMRQCPQWVERPETTTPNQPPRDLNQPTNPSSLSNSTPTNDSSLPKSTPSEPKNSEPAKSDSTKPKAQRRTSGRKPKQRKRRNGRSE